MAFKFAAEETTTTIRDITWEVGRTGKLTPRASFDPVELAGATIRHATLNNFDDIQRKRVGIGSRVFIRRSNDVIPEILSAVEGEVPKQEWVRFRTLGCYPLTGAIESHATTLPEIIEEMLVSTSSERQGRVIDNDGAGSMELKKRQGYF